MLRLEGIEKHFGGVHALKGVNFDLAAAEVHAIVGENGAGKSTLIKILSGLYRADRGTIELDGKPITIDSAVHAQSLGIQTVHQELELAGPLTVAENVFMGQLPQTRFGLVDFAAMERETRKGLAMLGANIDPEALVAGLTVGDRQIVELTRSILRQARVLIMDEPTAALPPEEVRRLFEVIRRLTAAGTAVIYVSHRLDEVIEIADRITVLRDGRLAVTIQRAEADRKKLVRHILGRELSEFHAERHDVGSDEPALVSCRALSSPLDLSNLDFDLRPGEVLGFFGLLGAGQSTIADALFGLRPAKAERCTIAGIDRLPANPKGALARGVGYVPADRKGVGLALRLSILENLFLTDMRSIARFGFVRQRYAHAKAEALVEEYSIRCHSVDQLVEDLSGGNQQKVSVAKWATRDVQVLFLDEPTRGVDVGARVEIYRFMREFAAKGRGVLIASSDPAEIASVCDRAIVLKEGRVSAALPLAALNENALLAAAL
jgi:ribose transport system ATP-binding protein